MTVGNALYSSSRLRRTVVARNMHLDLRRINLQNDTTAHRAICICSVYAKNRRQLRQHFIHDRVGDAFQLFPAARAKIERTGLIGAHNTHRLGSNA